MVAKQPDKDVVRAAKKSIRLATWIVEEKARGREIKKNPSHHTAYDMALGAGQVGTERAFLQTGTNGADIFS